MLTWTFRSLADSVSCPRAAWLHANAEQLRALAMRKTFAGLALDVAARIAASQRVTPVAVQLGNEYRDLAARGEIVEPRDAEAHRVMAWAKRIQLAIAATPLPPFDSSAPLDTCDVVRVDDDLAISPPPGCSVLTLVDGSAKVIAVLPDGYEQWAADAVKSWAHFALGAEAKVLFVSAQPVKEWPMAEVLMQLGAQAQGVSNILRGDMPAKVDGAPCGACRFGVRGKCAGGTA